MTPLDDLISWYENAPPLLKQLSHAVHFGPPYYKATWRYDTHGGYGTGVIFGRGAQYLGGPEHYTALLRPILVTKERRGRASIAAHILAILLAQRTKAGDVKIYPERIRTMLRAQYKNRIEYRRNCERRYGKTRSTT